MKPHVGASTRGGPLGLQTGAPVLEDQAFERLWQAFMTARVSIAGALLFVHVAIYALNPGPANHWVLGLCTAYLVATLVVRVARRGLLGATNLREQWVSTIAVDVLMFSALELMQVGSINFSPLFALPVLLSSVLGSLRLAIGTAASVTILLLLNAWWLGWLNRLEFAPQFLQAGLTGAACFMLAFLVHQLAARLAREEQIARRSQRAARLQREVNELVIETLTDGILVVDGKGQVRVANPAARRLIGPGHAAPVPPFDLTGHPGWAELEVLAASTFLTRNDGQADLSVQHLEENARRLQVRTRLTATPAAESENLCVMFLQDLRELEARLRTDKLVAMGRMSTAVAHEIRNPLAAIAQANQLLEEDLHEPAQRRLALMVRQNAQRLGKIVDEVLDIARVKHASLENPRARVHLDPSVAGICADWCKQNALPYAVTVLLDATRSHVDFDADHLRRVLINLLDNAWRHNENHTTAIEVRTQVNSNGRATLHIWSAGAPLEKTVEQHLFEPFFSSESRSSGLGLYICRELCERHRASISYQRAQRPRHNAPAEEGNEFSVSFRAERASDQLDEPITVPAFLS